MWWRWLGRERGREKQDVRFYRVVAWFQALDVVLEQWGGGSLLCPHHSITAQLNNKPTGGGLACLKPGPGRTSYPS